MIGQSERFYHIGEVDEQNVCMVTFCDGAERKTCDEGYTYDWDAEIYEMPVTYFPGMEENIRANYRAWLNHAREYTRQRRVMESFIAAQLSE